MKVICKALGIPEEDFHWCNGVMGVPITFLDNSIAGSAESRGKGFSMELWNSKSRVAQPLVRGSRAYRRLFAKRT